MCGARQTHSPVHWQRRHAYAGQSVPKPPPAAPCPPITACAPTLQAFLHPTLSPSPRTGFSPRFSGRLAGPTSSSKASAVLPGGSGLLPAKSPPQPCPCLWLADVLGYLPPGWCLDQSSPSPASAPIVLTEGLELNDGPHSEGQSPAT